jgi:phage terminase large subunit-like protein
MESQSGAEKLADLPKADRDKFLSALTDAQALQLRHDWRGFNARPNQIAPEGEWDIWLALAGRGFGKTRMGAEWVREKVDSGQAKRIAIIAETAADARDVLVEGDSGLLSLYPEGEGPDYQPSKRRITWANGAVATLFNATEPNQLRGPQYDLAWSDELAKWRYARETWDQLQFGLRLGDNPQQIVTTTPRPIELIKAIIAGNEGEVVITSGNTMDNASNLAGKFLDKIVKRYQGTRLGRQELNAEILGDIPNALWSLQTIDLYRTRDIPEHFDRIVVAVDPAVTSTEASDEHGIIVAGMSGEDGYVLEDASIKGTPNEWALAAVTAYDKWSADCIVAEVNQGGDMVENTIHSVRKNIKVDQVRATRGKHIRAEPVSSLYQQGRIHHVGAFVDLETQLTMMTSAGYEGEDSPDRADALVWAFTRLFKLMTREPSKTPPPLSIPNTRRI